MEFCRRILAVLTVIVIPGCGLSPQVADVSPEDLRDGGQTSPARSETPPVQLTTFQSAKSRHAMRKLDELILFQPTRYPAGDWSPDGLKFQDVKLKSADGTRLHAWFCPAENSRASVLFLHGNAGHLASRAEFLKVLQQDLRVDVLIVDYRGYGKSEGRATIEGAIADVRAASRTLASMTGVRESELILWGRSLGGALAVQLAAQIQPRGLIVQSSFSSLKETAAEHFPRLAWLVGRKRLNSVEKIARYHGSLLQCHGTSDRVISFASGQRLFEAANEPKRFLRHEGLGHNDQTPASFFREVDQFLVRLSKTPAAVP